jgi:hypothetical protein
MIPIVAPRRIWSFASRVLRPRRELLFGEAGRIMPQDEGVGFNKIWLHLDARRSPRAGRKARRSLSNRVYALQSDCEVLSLGLPDDLELSGFLVTEQELVDREASVDRQSRRRKSRVLECAGVWYLPLSSLQHCGRRSD